MKCLYPDFYVRLNTGAEVNVKENDGWTLLHDAATSICMPLVVPPTYVTGRNFLSIFFFFFL